MLKTNLFIHSLKCRFDIFVIVPHEEVANRLHAFSFPIYLELQVKPFGISWNFLGPQILRNFILFHSKFFHLPKQIVLDQKYVVILRLAPNAVCWGQLGYIQFLDNVESFIGEEEIFFIRSICF